jgi:integrase
MGISDGSLPCSIHSKEWNNPAIRIAKPNAFPFQPFARSDPSTIRFSVTSKYWIMDRINTAIGHIRLDKLTAHHLEQFYKNLSEPGVRQRAEYAVTEKLPAMMKKQKISAAALARKAGVSDTTIIAAKKGNHIRPAKAEAICKALNCPFDKLFTLKRDGKCLTGNTIAHYHRFISAVLMTAKKQRLIPFNVASEQCTPPKVEHKEAKYLDDNQARQFLGALMSESDIRVKTSLILLLFSGMRRGELLGLSWSDIDFEKKMIHIRRSSQVQKGKGVTEAPTKNKFSVRDVRLSGFVFELLAQYRIWIYSTRKLEQACRKRVDFMWLLQGEHVPDYSTFARFRTGRTKDTVEDLFYQFALKLEAMGETEHDEVFIDGTKLESMANCYTFIWRKTTEKHLEKVKEKVRQEFESRKISGNVTLKNFSCS